MAENDSTQMTRKQFVKLLLAAGGATTAAAFLPDKWMKPKVGFGVLPVHAASSNEPITISELIIQNPITFNYSDPLGQITDAALIYVNSYIVFNPGVLTPILSGIAISSISGGSRSGNGFSGQVTLPYTGIVSNPVFGTHLTVRMRMGTRDSNTLDEEIPT
jgi:hypothetical protein